MLVDPNDVADTSPPPEAELAEPAEVSLVAKSEAELSGGPPSFITGSLVVLVRFTKTALRAQDLDALSPVLDRAVHVVKECE
jgi:hypothetical protein